MIEKKIIHMYYMLCGLYYQIKIHNEQSLCQARRDAKIGNTWKIRRNSLEGGI